jgi:hypothetical protein
MVVNGRGFALRFNGTSWSGPTRVFSGEGPAALSCVDRGFCLAVSYNGNLSVYRGRWSTPTALPFHSATVSCATRTFCLVVTGNGHSLTFDGATWSSGPDVHRGMSAISCTSSTFCVAVGRSGAFRYTGHSWLRTLRTRLPVNLIAVSCAGQSLCAALDSNAGFAFVAHG